MANTKIPVELSSTPSIVDNGDATAITIDSSEKVGIGITPTEGKLHVKSDGAGEVELLTLENSTGTNGMSTLTFKTTSTDSTKSAQIAAKRVNSSGHTSLIMRTYNGSTSDALTINQNGVVFKPLQPAFEATVGTTFSGDGSVGGTETFVFSSARVNVGSHYNTSTGIFTAPVDGIYCFNFLLSPASNSQGTRYFRAQLVKNTDVIFAPHNTISDETGNADYNLVSGGGVVSLSATDTVKIQFGSSLATNNYTFYEDLCSFSGYLIG